MKIEIGDRVRYMPSGKWVRANGLNKKETWATVTQLGSEDDTKAYGEEMVIVWPDYNLKENGMMKIGAIIRISAIQEVVKGTTRISYVEKTDKLLK